VILAKTVKGYGLGEAGEGRNITHQQKKLNEVELRHFRNRFAVPLSDQALKSTPFYRPAEDSEEMKYLVERRRQLGGFVPERRDRTQPVEVPDRAFFDEFWKGSGESDVATTMVYSRLLSKLLRHESVGKLVVPIIPDEARTFGMDSLFRQAGIYASGGQVYEPVDSDVLLYYKEAKDGQILEEGITEAGSMASFIAAGTSHAIHGVTTIPFFTFYSMFGFQRVGDLIWAAADARARGFLMGGTAGRTTLAGEGLQHQDGHSHVVASTVPCVRAYDPAFGFELAHIIHEGLRRMYGEDEDLIYYVTLYNEKYAMPDMPKGVEEGILRGLYLYRKTRKKKGPKVQLVGSGPILLQALAAADRLESDHGVRCDVWSATSFTELRRDAIEVDRWNRFHPDQEPRVPYVTEVLGKTEGPVVAATDYMRVIVDQIAAWVPGGITALGTDGFGRSDNRKALRAFFEIDDRAIAASALSALARRGEYGANQAAAAIRDLGVDPERPAPWTVD
jgi:pyruvate dehydrogenase E1 component